VSKGVFLAIKKLTLQLLYWSINMFDVRLYKEIWNKKKEEVDAILDLNTKRNSELNVTTYFHDVELDFPPFIGLELSYDDWMSGKIIRVLYDVDDKRFYCKTDAEYPYDSIEYSIGEVSLNSDCLARGWKLLPREDC
jgi:hypothetical protein